MGEVPRLKRPVPLEDSVPRASLESILCTEELHVRSSRPPDYKSENRALVALGSGLTDSPTTIFQRLADTILDITQCDSAGLSLLTKDGKTPDIRGERFYWPAIAGMWNPHVGGGTPRNFGPCGDVLDQNRTLLFRHFERRYPYLLPVTPAATECLLAPFYVGDDAVGTIWAIMHSDRRKFDAEDDRVMASLGKFASSAYQARRHLEDLQIQVREREKAEAALRELTEGLEGQVQARTAELQVSEERLRLAHQAAHIGAFEWNIQTGVNTWTPELEKMYGLPPGGFGGTQTAFENLVYPDDRAGVIASNNRAVKTGLPTHGKWRVVWPDGSVHWITGRWQVFMNESGEPSRMIGVNADVTERKQAEEALVELNRTLEAQSALLQSSEELLKTFVKNVPAAVAMLDRDMRYLQVSDRWCTDYLSGREQVVGRSHYEIFPDMPERWKEVHRRCLQGETLRADEDRWDGQGGPHWARWEIRPWKTPEGTVGGILILAEDITRRKQMEEELSGMTRKLIDAQEQERARIGRELHDDVNQRLAILAIELERLRDNPSEAGIRVDELLKQLGEISNDVQALSHDLHSSKLEYLGVVRGMKSWCQEFGEHQKMEVAFESDVAGVLPPDLGLTLFRVLQEALHNAAKHSGVKRFDVQLREDSGEIHLIVSDLGRGFDVENALRGKGLGFTSMRERVRLVNGTIAIDSEQMRGTSIHVRVPLASGQHTRGANA